MLSRRERNDITLALSLSLYQRRNLPGGFRRASTFRVGMDDSYLGKQHRTRVTSPVMRATLLPRDMVRRNVLCSQSREALLELTKWPTGADRVPAFAAAVFFFSFI